MSIREALMEMAHGKKPKTERAAWVPESILDDDVSHFMGAAAAAKKAGKSHFDFGGKKYKVTMKHDTAKKVDESAECPTCEDGECQCEQPVEEAKINELSKGTLDRYRQVAYNDRIRQSGNRQRGEDDTPGMKKRDAGIALATKKSDAKGPGFTPKRRSADVDIIKFKSKKESVEVEENYKTRAKQTSHKTRGSEKTPAGFKPGMLKRKERIDALKKVSMKKEDKDVEENYTDKQDASYRDEPTPKGAQKRLKALHKKALAYRKKHGVFPSVRKKQKDLAMKKNKSDLKFESVEEATKATAQHKPTAETSDTWDKQLATRKGEKDFIDKHEMDVALDAEKLYDQNKYEALKKTPVRNGDKTDGDKSVVNPLSADMVTGMRKALAQMKLSGE